MRTDSYIQWYNENEGRAYPLCETATRVDDSNQRMPDDIIVDLCLMLPPAYQACRISSIRITPTVVTLGICSGITGLFVGTYVRSDVEPHKAYPLTGVIDNATGWISFGRHNAVSVEDYRFGTFAQSSIELRAVRVVDPLPIPALVKLGGNPLQTLSGIVKVAPGSGILVEKDPGNPQNIIVKLDPNSQQAVLGPCENKATKDVCKVEPIRSINGVYPNSTGKITLRFE